MTAFRTAEKQTDIVLDLTSPSELTGLEERLHVLRGLLDAFARLEAVNNAIRSSSNHRTALAILQQEPFGYSRQQAQAVLDMPMYWQTFDNGEHLQAELDRLESRRAALRQHVGETAAHHWFG